MELELMKKRIYLINKWDIIREKRKEEALEKEKILEKQIKNKNWINLINGQVIIKHIF